MIVELLGGAWSDAGTVGEVELRPLTGRDEVWLCDLAPELPAAAVITGLLGRCAAGAVDRRVAVDELLPADRDFLLLWLRRLTYGSRFDAVVQCPLCARWMDVGFDADEIPVERRPHPRRLHELRVRTAKGSTIVVGFHLPTGADQLAAAGATDPARDLLHRCVELIDGAQADPMSVERLDEEAVGQLEDGMERLSPVADLAMDLVCPECERAFAADYELAPYMLDELRAGSRSVLREVHALAFCYHWSESEILDLPRSRRRAYLDLVTDQLRREEER